MSTYYLNQMCVSFIKQIVFMGNHTDLYICSVYMARVCHEFGSAY